MAKRQGKVLAWTERDTGSFPPKGESRCGDVAMEEGLIESRKRDGFYIVKYDDWNHRARHTHDARNIYRLPVDAEGRRAGAPIQLTVGASRDAWSAVSREGRMVFASGSEHVNVWAVPLDANASKVTGAPYRVSGSLAHQSHPVISPDGRKLLFNSTRSEVLQMWQNDLTTGRETLIVPQAGSSPEAYMPASGRIAYRICNAKRGGACDSYILDPATGESRMIFSNGYIWSINRAETLALVTTPAGTLAGIDGFDLKSGLRFPLLQAQRDQWNLYDAYFSPDERWTLVLVKAGADTTRIFVARLKGATTAPNQEWLPVTDESLVVDKPRFSPDGGLIYFTFDRENSRCIYAVRFDAESGKPRGEPFLVLDFPGPRQSMFQVDLGQLNISVARDKLVTVLSEANWNIWMTDLHPKQ